eukprot:TRINITY_DN11537_c0_g1_i1.p1 TRINITY_DN11537_c0_g1~~TRINITY_DN11537_c0_g1_i1.p1  ORF type:complete len:621 (+),score=208.60 TRINITY_DN11537_c0_g1_i1:44-1864(+)
MPKKKGPDPQALLAEQKEVEALTRGFYLGSFKRESAKSQGHRAAKAQGAKVPGFEPEAALDIDQEKLDRLMARRNQRQNWEDADDADGSLFASNEDPDCAAHQEYLRSIGHDLSDSLYHIMSSVDGLPGKADLEIKTEDVKTIFEAVEQHETTFATSRTLNSFSHQIFAKGTEPTDITDPFEALYERKKIGLVEELCGHFKCSVGWLTMLSVAVSCRFMQGNVSRTFLEVLVMFLYSCDPVMIDKMLGRWEGAEPPADYQPQAPNIAQTLTDAIRNRDLKVLGAWINFVATLASCNTELPEEVKGKTLYLGIKEPTEELQAVIKNIKPDDVLYLPCLASCAVEFDAVTQSEPAMLFLIRGVRSGVDLTQCCQTPDNTEVLLAAFSCVKVRSKLDANKVELEMIGSGLDAPESEISKSIKQRWVAFCKKVRGASRGLFGESKTLQVYMSAYRQAVAHKQTLQALGTVIQQTEAEHEANIQAAEKLKAEKGAKGAPVPKPEDLIAALDANKVGALDGYLQVSRHEQFWLQQQLAVLDQAIAANKQTITTQFETFQQANEELRLLCNMQTQHYNALAVFYEKESKKIETIQTRLSAMKPMPKKPGGKKK